MLAPVVGMATEESWAYANSATEMPTASVVVSSAASGKVPLKSSREKAVQFFSMYCVQSSNRFVSLVSVTSSVV